MQSKRDVTVTPFAMQTRVVSECIQFTHQTKFSQLYALNKRLRTVEPTSWNCAEDCTVSCSGVCSKSATTSVCWNCGTTSRTLRNTASQRAVVCIQRMASVEPHSVNSIQPWNATNNVLSPASLHLLGLHLISSLTDTVFYSYGFPYFVSCCIFHSRWVLLNEFWVLFTQPVLHLLFSLLSSFLIGGYMGQWVTGDSSQFGDLFDPVTDYQLRVTFFSTIF